MSDVTRLPDNLIGKEDHRRLESFGGHIIGRGRATRWHWGQRANTDPVFELYKGGAEEYLAYGIARDRRRDAFLILDANGHEIDSGELDHVLAVLDQILMREHQQIP